MVGEHRGCGFMLLGLESESDTQEIKESVNTTALANTTALVNSRGLRTEASKGNFFVAFTKPDY